MNGIQFGIEREATTALLSSSRLTPLDKGTLRSILAGAVWTQDRLYRASLVSSPTCPYCDALVAEDHRHMWWSCAAWAHLRIEHCGDLLHEVSAWPECLAVCGLLPAGFCSLPAAVPLFIDLTIEDDTNAPAEIVAAAVGLNSSHPVAEICHDNRIVIYTDGACRGNQTRAIRRAGVGVFWGIGHRFNISEPLNGAQQTNQRAELFAVIRALETDDRRLEIRTDSKYVYDGCRANMARWKANEWQIGRRAVSNMDLWQRLDALIVARQPDDICVLKVKGHAKARDILSGATTAQDKAGNDAADELAVAGAAMHAISPEGRRSALQATLLASRVQHTMLSILLARNARQQQQPARGDSGDSSHSETSSSSSSSSSSSDDDCIFVESSSSDDEDEEKSDGRLLGRQQALLRSGSAPAAAE
jgi:ribonuclease HI